MDLYGLKWLMAMLEPTVLNGRRRCWTSTHAR